MALREGPYKDVVSALIRQRKKLGLTQLQVDGIVGWTEYYCAKLESGQRTAKLLTLLDWATALDAQLVMRKKRSIRAKPGPTGTSTPAAA